MLLTATYLALSLAAGPQPQSCTAPTQTGIFRIVALSKDSTSARLGMILLENVGDCLEASMLTDNAGPAVIDGLALSGDTLTGRVLLPTGSARVTLRLTATTIDGSIVDGKHVWSVSGRRTTGDVRIAAGAIR